MKIGVIADDFTGAGDIGSFLQKNGSKTLRFFILCGLCNTCFKIQKCGTRGGSPAGKRSCCFSEKGRCRANLF